MCVYKYIIYDFCNIIVLKGGRFTSRSEAIKTMMSFYEEGEKTREFACMLASRSKEAREKPDILVPLEYS